MAGNTLPRRLSSLSDPTDPTTILVLFILEALALFFTLSTIVSTYYFSFRTSIFFNSDESATTFYSLYESCSTTTVYSDSIQAAAKGMCAAIYFAEIFMVLAFISQCFAFFLYLVTDSATLLPSGERAWVLLYKAHMTCTVFLVVALAVAAGLFRNMRRVLLGNLINSQEGSFRFSWGFAFHILALLLHVAVVLVLVTATTNAGRAGGGPSVREQQAPVPVEQQQQLVDEEDEADSEENRGKLKEALLTMEGGGEGLIGAAAMPSPSRRK